METSKVLRREVLTCSIGLVAAAFRRYGTVAEMRRRRAVRIAHLTDTHLGPRLDVPNGSDECLAPVQSPSERPDLIVTQRIEYSDGGTVLEGILAYDESVGQTEKRPGVLVCHSYWGVNDFTESRVRQLAGLGYVAFVLDVFGKGTQTDDPKTAGQNMVAALGDLPALRKRAALGLQVLAEQPGVERKQLAVIGYCFGGTVALELARSGLAPTDNLQAVVAFHSARLAATGDEKEIENADPWAPVADPFEANTNDSAEATLRLNRNIKCPVLVCHGAVDPLVKPGEVETFQKQMREAKVDYVFVSYAGAVHAFTDPGADARNSSASKYNANADRRSWQHMKDFFCENLPFKPQRNLG